MKRLRFKSYPWSSADPALLADTYREQRDAERAWAARVNRRVNPTLPTVREAQMLLFWMGEDWPHSSAVRPMSVREHVEDVAEQRGVA